MAKKIFFSAHDDVILLAKNQKAKRKVEVRKNFVRAAVGDQTGRYCKYHNGEKKVPPQEEEVKAKIQSPKRKVEVRKNFVRA